MRIVGVVSSIYEDVAAIITDCGDACCVPSGDLSLGDYVEVDIHFRKPQHQSRSVSHPLLSLLEDGRRFREVKMSHLD